MSTADLTRSQRLHELLAEFYQTHGSGTEADRLAFIRHHPDFASDLASYFAEQNGLANLIRPLADLSVLNSPFGDYELLRELDRGGMGIVFEARQKSLNRPVALKMIVAGALATDDNRRRFAFEAEAAASLDHPHIVPIFEVGCVDGLSYYTMKLIPGGSLADRLDDFGFDLPSAASLVATVARAVDHAHRRGVLHRDLKPSNILLDADGQPLVSDFGLARRLDGGSDLSLSGTPVGTPSYMSPEQAFGRKADISVATDVYGLGAILYALLTGRPPFRADSALATLERVRDHAPDRPSELNPRVDRDLETICLKCLAKDPSRRYGSALAVAEDLQRWLSGDPITARPCSRWERFGRWCRRPERVVETGVFVLLLNLGLTLFCLTSFPAVAWGLVRLDRPRALLIHALRCILFVYLPTAWVGSQIIARKRWAPAAGLFLALSSVVLTIVSMSGFTPVDLGGGSYDDPTSRWPLESLCSVLFAFETLACGIAWLATRAERSTARQH